MSKLREQFESPPAAPLAAEATGDLKPYVIFTQLRANGPYIYAGWLEAADDDMAIAFAKEHYGQDQECVNIQAIRRDDITSSDGLYGARAADSPSPKGGGKGVGGPSQGGIPPALATRSTHPPTPSLVGRGRSPSSQPAPSGKGTYAVFTQKRAGDLWLDAGTVEASDPQAAIESARNLIKQATNAHAVWVVEQSHVLATHGDLIWRHTDQSYRLARGYGREVRAKWIAFRDEKQLAEYEKDDLQDAF